MDDLSEFVGKNPMIKEIRERVEKLAPYVNKFNPPGVKILLCGEPGTGKEVLARLIHARSGRKGKFVAVNCAALPSELVVSELFGHEQGAFTGAIKRNEGLFKAAKGGTIFLDEIGDMPLHAQAMLLRALQDNLIRSVGSTEEVRLDARIIAATNQNLSAEKFRQDLYGRLKTFTIRIPPLRERREDIPHLIEHFCRMRGVTAFCPPALWMAYSWPHNVRELEGAVDQAIAEGIDAVCLDIAAIPPQLPQVHIEPVTHGTVSLPHTVRELKKTTIIAALQNTEGNIERAAKLLGMKRTTLAASIKRLGLKVTSVARIETQKPEKRREVAYARNERGMMMWERMHAEVAIALKTIIEEIEERSGSINISKIAQKLGISRSTLYRLHEQGKLPELAPYVDQNKNNARTGNAKDGATDSELVDLESHLHPKEADR